MHIDGVQRLAPGDVPSLIPLIQAAALAGDLAGSSEPGGTFFVRDLEREPGLVAVARDHDEPVGFVSPEFKMLVVAPPYRRRGHGLRLVEAGLAIERERSRPNLLLGPPPGSRAAVAFLEATAFAYHSTLWDLRLPPDRLVPLAVWPEGIRAQSFDRSRDVGAWVRLFNDTFAGHATPLQIDEAGVTSMEDDPSVVDEDLLILEEPGDEAGMVGFCSTDPRRSGGAIGVEGEIWTIGVRPDRQGRGLGRQLLRWGVGYLRGLGVRHVELSVNGRNEHALRLYEDEGFERAGTRERWARPVNP